jgi:hypothetical protein
MIDCTTKEPLRVLIEGNAPPFIEVPFDQLEDLQRVLDVHDVAYTVDEDIISIDGGPEFVIVDLGRKGDAGAVQAILDSAQ